MEVLEKIVHKKFLELFQREPVMVRAPGRINLIGEHTDYNDGFVMPAAIDKEIIFAIAPSADGKSSIYSMMFNEHFQVDLNNPKKVQSPKWANYLLGVLYQYQQKGFALKPFHCVFGGEVPMGAGLSSSAALETGFAFAIQEINSIDVEKLDLIKMAQWSEHNYVGVKCGIMDQFASVMGKEGHVIVLDCRDLSYRYSPLDLKEYVILLCDSKVKHSLVDSEYNTRRRECESGVDILKKYFPEIKSLRDVTIDMLNKHRSELPGKVYDRCRYVVEEIARVQAASLDLNNGDLTSFGKKMFDTHRGLSVLYEVSCKELDFLVEFAKQHKSIVGSRMMGGGFGGCTINIIHQSDVDSFSTDVKKEYQKKFSIGMESYRVNIKDGTSLFSLTDVLTK